MNLFQQNRIQGFLKAYYEATEEQLEQLMTANPLQYPGVENSITFAEWLWNSGIADNFVLIRLDSKQCVCPLIHSRRFQI